jgi:hypothetical protein
MCEFKDLVDPDNLTELLSATAYKTYSEAKENAFWELFSDPKNRNEYWK